MPLPNRIAVQVYDLQEHCGLSESKQWGCTTCQSLWDFWSRASSNGSALQCQLWTRVPISIPSAIKSRTPRPNLAGCSTSLSQVLCALTKRQSQLSARIVVQNTSQKVSSAKERGTSDWLGIVFLEKRKQLVSEWKDPGGTDRKLTRTQRTTVPFVPGHTPAGVGPPGYSRPVYREFRTSGEPTVVAGAT